GSPVRIGLDGVLFSDEDIGFYNREDRQFDQGHVDELADRIAALQARLQAEHRALVPVIIPSKTTIYRDKIPDRLARSIGQPRVSDLRLYLAMKRALDARKISYVDARAMFELSTEPRDL